MKFKKTLDDFPKTARHYWTRVCLKAFELMDEAKLKRKVLDGDSAYWQARNFIDSESTNGELLLKV